MRETRIAPKRSARSLMHRRRVMYDCIRFIGLDVHRRQTVVAIAEVRSYGAVESDRSAIEKRARKLTRLPDFSGWLPRRRNAGASRCKPRPANSHVSRARCVGLTKTRAKACLASTRRSLPANRRPVSVKGTSVAPMCWPLRLQAVSPCLITKTCTYPAPDRRSVITPFTTMRRVGGADWRGLYLIRVLPETGGTVAAGTSIQGLPTRS